MKIKKMSFYAWTLIAAMVISVLPVNAVSVKAATAKILDVNTLEVGTEYTSEQPVKVGDFSYVAKSDKPITVNPYDEPKKATDGKEFTKWIKFQGGACQIRFDMAANEKVKVYYTSGGTDEREIGFYSSAAVAAEIAAGATTYTPLDRKPAPSNAGDIAIAEFTAKEAGEYFIASVTKSMQVYYIQVGEDVAETPKTETKTETKVETPIVPTGNTYTVQKGDTLCSIARRLFNAEAKWSDIYNWNKATIKDPALIYIGQVLNINGETAAPAEETKPAETTAAEVKNLTAKATGYHDIATNTRMLKTNLTWTAADGATSYDVYRGAEKIATVSVTNYEDTTAMTDTSVEYAVAVAGASNKAKTTVTSIGYDITLLQEQTDNTKEDKPKVTPSTAPGYLPVIVQGKNDTTPVTVYGKDGNKYGVNLDKQVGRYRMTEVIAMGWPQNDLRAGEAIVDKANPVVFTTEVPNGTYNVYVLCGELDSIQTGAKHKVLQKISVNGSEAVTTEAAENGAFVDTTITADVTDGKLVVTISGEEGKGRVNGIIVTSTAK